ncbi:MAG: 2-oxoglutarate dehydrogenase complex dihydrolipoyllysine-residue succinyltransferase [Pyrinomonadaceae bacterium]|nr:2-oxoglutarate dehydrogenase complex dihydrolipoyllysine-residue succinyltransferase [Phycisphaerales bacterium]
MALIDIVIPTLGESVDKAVVLEWRVPEGGVVKRDETIVVLETDKINAELPAPASGMVRQVAKVGQTVNIGDLIGKIDDSVTAPAAASGTPAVPAGARATGETAGAGAAASSSSPASAMAGSGVVSAKSAAAKASATIETPPSKPPATNGQSSGADVRATPLAKKAADELGLDLSAIKGTGPGGKVSEQDVEAAARTRNTTAPASNGSASSGAAAQPASTQGRGIRRERMTMLRQKVASRLVEAQHTAAMLTTFNECDMSAIMALRTQHKEAFEKKHGVGLGFMSFFVKAAVAALKQFPAANASIAQGKDGPEVEFHDYQDISVAIGTPKGLVVPVLRDCQNLSFAQVESGIKELATRAKDGKLALADLQGGTFTITNGGIYGSLMSTPILNPPQTGILGMHAIKNRAVEYPVGSGQVGIRPMMYLALSYDHRLIDGSEAVQFLVVVKNAIEDPTRLLLGM